jgi:hypothetical protein
MTTRFTQGVRRWAATAGVVLAATLPAQSSAPPAERAAASPQAASEAISLTRSGESVFTLVVCAALLGLVIGRRLDSRSR